MIHKKKIMQVENPDF